MKLFLASIQLIFLVAVIFLLQIVASYFLPSPFNHISPIIIFLAWLTIRSDTEKALWFALIFGFLNELVSSEVFGINMAALIAAVLVLRWLLRTVFTNYSWYMTVCVGFLFALGYQCLLTIFEVGIDLLKHQSTVYSWKSAEAIVLGALMNTVGLVVIYLTIGRLSKRYSPRYI